MIPISENVKSINHFSIMINGDNELNKVENMYYFINIRNNEDELLIIYRILK